MLSNNKKILIAFLIVLGILLVLPLFPEVVVPQWAFRLVYENGESAKDISVEQAWKEYSLEFWRNEEHVAESEPSDDNGYITLPAREIQISLIQILLARIRNAVADINPHSSFGPHSYVVCRHSVSCYASFRAGESPPELVVVKR